MKFNGSFAGIYRSLITIALIVLVCIAAAHAQATSFTYQGKLSDGPAAANGTYDLEFALFDVAANGTMIGAAQTRAGISIANGIFTVQLDFGANPFTSGANRFLEIAVKRSADTAFTTLAPRQQLTAAPFSIQSLRAASADSLSADCVSCVSNAQIASIDGSKVTGTVANAASAATAANVDGATELNNANAIVKRDGSGNFIAGKIFATSFEGNATSATTVVSATNLNSANTIVKRDGSGNFIAGSISATTFNGALNGNASSATDVVGATNLNNANAIVKRDGSGNFIAGKIFATSFEGNATSATTVVGATNLNSANTIVKRDGSGNFAAGSITATTFNGALNGNAATATTAANFSGNLSGAIIGTQGATAIASNQVVKSVNGLKDAVILAGTSDITVTSNGNTLTIGAGQALARKYAVNFDVPFAANMTLGHPLGTMDVQIEVYRLVNNVWEQAAGFQPSCGADSQR